MCSDSQAASAASTRNSSSPCSANDYERKLRSSDSSTPETMYTDVCPSSSSESTRAETSGSMGSRTSFDSKLNEHSSSSSTSLTSGATPNAEESNFFPSMMRQSTLEHMFDAQKAIISEPADSSPTGSLISLMDKTLTSRVKTIASPPPVWSRKSFSEINELLRRASEMIQSESLVENQNDEVFDNAFLHLEEKKPTSSQSFDANHIATILTREYQIQTTDFFVKFFRYQGDINNSSDVWYRLSHETDVEMLSALLWFWLEMLEEPLLDRKTLVHVVIKAEKPVDALMKLQENSRFLIEYLIRFIARLRPESEQALDLLIKRFIASITHQMIRVPKRSEAASTSKETDEVGENPKTSRLIPGFRENWPEMRKGTIGRTVTFFKAFYSLLMT